MNYLASHGYYGSLSWTAAVLADPQKEQAVDSRGKFNRRMRQAAVRKKRSLLPSGVAGAKHRGRKENR